MGDGSGATQPVSLEPSDVLRILTDGELAVEGRLVDASNATLYCAICLGGVELRCVYKPVRGERPLWDFPDGTLAGREVAAYLVSEATGWDLIPPTVLRDGPFGLGMCQLWLDVDITVDPLALVKSEHPDLRRLVVLDAVINNADRKGSHLLPLPDGRVFGVDHGVCFAVEDKLRTVLWQWRGQPLDEEALDTLDRVGSALSGSLGADLGGLLTGAEVRRTAARVRRLRSRGHYPLPQPDWPALPWPPF